MRDSFGRTINYLRLSVTEACNFRCQYCAPGGHPRQTARPLTLDEIESLVCTAVSLGINRIRLTGGEPLMRRDCVEIVGAISGIQGVQDLALTTNAYRLAELARPLADAGLRRVNISLDTLRPARFAGIVGRDEFERVWRGIEAAENAGLAPLKLNVVALRGVNDDELQAFSQLTVEHPWHVRFIELMPVGTAEQGAAFFDRHFISASEMRSRIHGLEQSPSPLGNGPAKTYRLPHAQGTLGFITPASEHFCAACNRIRVTARGLVRPCLFAAQELNIRGALSQRDSRAARESLVQMIDAKPEHHPLGTGFALLDRAMSQIGG